MSAQAVTIVGEVGTLGVAEYQGQRTRQGGDWLFGTIITVGLLLSFVLAVYPG
jgi:hypothetical protein